MIRHDLPQKKSPIGVKLPVATHDLFITSVAPPHADLIRKDEKKISSESENESTTNLSWDALWEKPGNPDQFNLIRLVHKSLGANGRSERWLDGVQASCHMEPLKNFVFL